MTTHKSTSIGSFPPSFGGVGGGSYTHLFFDLDNTIWDFSANSRVAMKLTIEKLEFTKQLGSFDAYFPIYEQINESLWSDYRAKKISKQSLIIERFSRSFEAFQIRNQDWEGINRMYLDYMAQQTELFSGTHEILDYLKKKGYQMHIITNGFKEVQFAKLQNSNLSDYFGKVFISEEVQATKPHREIFEHALKTTNASKKKSIMIGDSWETDIEGAISFGIDQIMILNNGQNKVPSSIELLKESTNSSFLELKYHTRTWFINEFIGLRTIL